jgi:hypothetical protein
LASYEEIADFWDKAYSTKHMYEVYGEETFRLREWALPIMMGLAQAGEGNHGLTIQDLTAYCNCSHKEVRAALAALWKIPGRPYTSHLGRLYMSPEDAELWFQAELGHPERVHSQAMGHG